MDVAQVMVRYLEAAGVGHVFGYPGDPAELIAGCLIRQKVPYLF